MAASLLLSNISILHPTALRFQSYAYVDFLEPFAFAFHETKPEIISKFISVNFFSITHKNKPEFNESKTNRS